MSVWSQYKRESRFNSKREKPVCPDMKLSEKPFKCKKIGMFVKICRMPGCQHFIECHKNN